jgi:hypothetical protein
MIRLFASADSFPVSCRFIYRFLFQPLFVFLSGLPFSPSGVRKTTGDEAISLEGQKTFDRWSDE